MDNTPYQVVLLGVKPGDDPRRVKARLASAFRVYPEKIEKLFSKLPVTVKSDVDYETALKYRDILQNAGGVCRLEPMKEAGAPSSPPPPGKASSTLKTCPHCGYDAKRPDDPLLTAHDGQGECPACGIIVSKYLANRQAFREDSSPSPETVRESPTLWEGIKSSILSRPWMSLFMTAVVIGLVVQFVLPDSEPEGEAKSGPGSAASRKEKRPPDTEKASKMSIDSLKILPGETGNLTMITYLGYFHRDEYSALSVTPKCTVDNKGEFGVEVLNVSVSPVSVSVWERQREKDGLWVPYGYRKVSSQGGTRGAIEKGKNLLYSPFPGELVSKQEDASLKEKEGDLRYRKSGYTLYQMKVDLSITAPSGTETGSADSKVGNCGFCVSTFFVIDIDENVESMIPSANSGRGPWKATKLTFMNSIKKNCINLKQERGQGGWIISPLDKFPEMPMYCELRLE